jgi:hypothetical protein
MRVATGGLLDFNQCRFSFACLDCQLSAMADLFGARQRLRRIEERSMYRLLTAGILAALLIIQISPARAAELPVLNVLPLCRGIVSQGADPLQTGVRSVSISQCLSAEQDDRATMKKEWSTFSAADRKHCIAEATMGGESSYTDLLTCLEMARDVRALKQSPAGTKPID